MHASHDLLQPHQAGGQPLPAPSCSARCIHSARCGPDPAPFPPLHASYASLSFHSSHSSRPQDGAFELERARLYTAEIVLALGHLHDVAELIYRDMKPDNVLIDA